MWDVCHLFLYGRACDVACEETPSQGFIISDSHHSIFYTVECCYGDRYDLENFEDQFTGQPRSHSQGPAIGARASQDCIPCQ